MSSTCLLVVDVQSALFDEGPDDAAGFLERLAALIAAARDGGVPVIYIQHAEPVGEPLTPGTPGWQIHPALGPRVGEAVFAKRFNSAFKETGLEAQLRFLKAQTLVVVGMQTEHCLDATIKSAFEKGFQVVVPEGSHTTMDNGPLSARQVKEFYQNRIWRGRYASVEPLSAVLERFAKA